jgi:hypothetical protein
MVRDIAIYYTQIQTAYNTTSYFYDYFPSADNIDLYGFAVALRARVPVGTDIYNAANVVITKINTMVINNKYDAITWPAGARGVTVYFPYDASQWSTYKSDYVTYQSFAQNTYWDEFLDVFY